MLRYIFQCVTGVSISYVRRLCMQGTQVGDRGTQLPHESLAAVGQVRREVLLHGSGCANAAAGFAPLGVYDVLDAVCSAKNSATSFVSSNCTSGR